MVILTKRQKDILLYLLESREYKTIQELSKHFDVSYRTIRYDIVNINEVLKESLHDVSILSVKNKGVLLDLDQSRSKEIKKMLGSVETRYLVQSERVEIIELLLLLEQARTYEHLATICLVSKQTIINDFPIVESEFSLGNIRIHKLAGIGLSLEGTEYAIRRYFEYLVNRKQDDISFFHEILHDFLKEYWLHEAKKLVSETRKTLNRRYIDTKEFLYQLAFTLQRIYGGHLCDTLSQNESSLDRMYEENDALLNFLKKRFPKEETVYIGNLFLSTKLYEAFYDTASKEKNEARRMAEYLMQELKQLMNTDAHKTVENDDCFIHHLELHLGVAMYRMRNNIVIENELLDQIKISIPLLYEFTKQKIEECESKFGLCFDEKEIAYIAMHIASAYEMNVQIKTPLYVILVCSFGLATSSMLKSRIMQTLPDCHIIGPFSESEANEYLAEHDVDLVIATNDYQSNHVTTIRVHPLLCFDDLNNMKEAILRLSYLKSCNFFINAYRRYEQNNEIIYLRDYVKKEDIQVVAQCRDWMEAIHMAAHPLLEKKLLEQRYIDKMVEAVNQLGNYMILSPETAFIHAGSDDGINATCTAVLILKKPVTFGSNSPEPVRNIVVLGMKNKEENSLLKIINIFGVESNLKILKSENLDVDIVYRLCC